MSYASSQDPFINWVGGQALARVVVIGLLGYERVLGHSKGGEGNQISSPNVLSWHKKSALLSWHTPRPQLSSFRSISRIEQNVGAGETPSLDL